MTDPQRPANKAYSNPDFLNGRDARALRILAEYLEPEARFDRLGVHDTIVFFGSARIPDPETAARRMAEVADGDGAGPAGAKAEAMLGLSRYHDAARQLADRLTRWSASLEDHPGRFVVCTGGGPGIMQAASQGAHEAGGQNVGLTIPIPLEEFQNPYVSDDLSFTFHYFFMRKFWFTYLAKAVVVMPGGFGTMDELFELLTLIQTLKMKKRPPIVLFGEQFWSDVLDLQALARYGTIDTADLDLFLRTDSIDEAFDYLTAALAVLPPSDAGAHL